VSRRVARTVLAVAVVFLSASCATTKIVQKNAQLVYNGQPLDKTGLHDALVSDTKDAQANLQTLQRKFAEALAVLKANVQKRWGQGDAKVADRTVYVKYTQGYKSRVITDFDHGSLTVETLEEKDPEGSLKAAIVAALLTSNDPAAVDLFSDKEVALEPTRKPYLFGLVHDNHGKSVSTRVQAEAFAESLVPQKMQTRAVTAEQGSKTARFVKLYMVKNFEAKGAEHYRASVDKYATQYHVSPSLVLAIIRTESNFNPFAVSGAPAYGLMQLVPTSGGREAYKRVQGVDQTPTPEYLFDPEHSIELGAAYLGVLDGTEFRNIENQESRDLCVIAAYNTGPKNVTRTFDSDRKQALNDINQLQPPGVYERLRTGLPFEETRQYVVRVTGYRKQFVATPATAATPSGT
jgi:membrane-bound lytic murein transglycosylase C